MRILILGGTVFVGRHTVEAALTRGHEVTLFNRGRQNPELFPELEKLRGDRESDPSALAGRRFDAVIDPSGFTPAHVHASAQAIDAGLTFRPVLETARDTLAWDKAEGAQPTERPIRVTPLTREREAELLRGADK